MLTEQLLVPSSAEVGSPRPVSSSPPCSQTNTLRTTFSTLFNCRSLKNRRFFVRLTASGRTKDRMSRSNESHILAVLSSFTQSTKSATVCWMALYLIPRISCDARVSNVVIFFWNASASAGTCTLSKGRSLL